MSKGKRRAGRAVLLFAIFLLLLGIWAWQNGWLGRASTPVLQWTVFPRQLGNVVELETLTADQAPPELAHGIILTLSPERFRQMLTTAWPGGDYLPPETIRDGLVLTGAYVPRRWTLPGSGRLPFMVVLSTASGRPPNLVLRYPSEDFNRLLKDFLSDKMKIRRKYFLGHYEFHYRIELDRFILKTVDEVASASPESRELAFERGKGRLRVRFEENIGRKTFRGRIRKAEGTVHLDVLRDAHGVGFDGTLRLHRIKVDFDNTNEILDSLMAGSLTGRLEDSLNKKLEKLANKRLPAWFPPDLVFRLEITPPETSAPASP